MNRTPLLLAVFVSALGLLTTARAQQTPTFQRHTVAVRIGALQTVNESTGGLAPYVEAQSTVHHKTTPLGLALYGGVSYERVTESLRIVCVAAPCPDLQSREMHLDLVTGLRLGIFPNRGPVSAFVGVASHFTHWTESFEDRQGWLQTTTLEAGVSTQLPVTDRIDVNLGVLGFLPVRAGNGAVHIGEWKSFDSEEHWNVDMSRIGFQLGVQYRP